MSEGSASGPVAKPGDHFIENMRAYWNTRPTPPEGPAMKAEVREWWDDEEDIRSLYLWTMRNGDRVREAMNE